MRVHHARTHAEAYAWHDDNVMHAHMPWCNAWSPLPAAWLIKKDAHLFHPFLSERGKLHLDSITWILIALDLP
jgi:ribulose-5-phosphate 4-epimerase/fuculose-1-phosphate aldolase